MNIRYGTTDDAKMLSELGAKTFYDTFAKDNTPENISLYMKKSFSTEVQSNELFDPVCIMFLTKAVSIARK